MGSLVVAWPMVALSEVLRPIDRSETPVAGKTYRTVGVKWWGEGVYEREPIDGSQTQYGALRRIEAGDIIINKIWARHGSVAVVQPSLTGCYASTEFPTWVADPNRLAPLWMHWLSKTKGFWEQCDEKSRGTSGKNRIRPERFLEIPIPLPPLDEQRRIVARIAAIAARIEEARGLRRAAMEEVEALLQSGANQALNGMASGVLIRIGELAEVRGGIQKSPSRAPGSNPVRYLTVAHVHRNHISLSDPRYFEVSADELDRWVLQSGDVLIIEGNGSADQIGRTALFRGELNPCVHQNHVIRIRPKRELVAPEYLNAYLNSPVGQDEVQSRSRTTSGLRILSVGRINQIHVKVPPLSEQHRIVAYLDGLQERVDALKRLQAESAAELEALLPAVLDRAFRGEL